MATPKLQREPGPLFFSGPAYTIYPADPVKQIDRVAADAYATSLFDKQPAGIACIKAL
jgi:hypothetical protein